jgi:hypothetical protein
MVDLVAQRQRARRQPQRLARLGSHPMARYLASAFVAGTYIDPVTGYIGANDGGRIVPTPDGLALKNPTSSGLGVKLAPGGLASIIPLSSNDFTIYVRCYVSALNVREFIFGDFTSSGSGCSIGLEKQSSNLWSANMRHGASSATISGGTVTVGWHDIVISQIRGEFQAYWNGRTENQFTVSASTNAGFDLRVGGAGGYAFLPFSGLVPFLYIFNKGFTGNELKAAGVFDNPYQLFQGRQELIAGAAASGGVIGTANITESDDISSGTVSVRVVGSAAITEGADSASGAAAVAVFGAASAMESGDTTSGSAAIGVLAAAAISEAADSASGTGAILVSGMATVNEAGDTLAASAAVISGVNASANITEAGDTTSGTAAISIAGTFTIGEAGDIADGSGTILISGAAVITEGGDTLSATAAVVSGVIASATISEAADTATGTGVITVQAQAVITEGGDIGAGNVLVAVLAAAGLTEANDGLSASASIWINAVATITEGADTVFGRGGQHFDKTIISYRVPAEDRFFRALAEHRIYKA